jgi:hypothetical protein
MADALAAPQDLVLLTPTLPALPKPPRLPPPPALPDVPTLVQSLVSEERIQ